MKLCGKILCLILALTMCMGLCISAFAVGEGSGAEGGTGEGGEPAASTSTDTKGSITLTNAAPGEDYKLYKLLDLVATLPTTSPKSLMARPLPLMPVSIPTRSNLRGPTFSPQTQQRSISLNCWMIRARELA